jgi:hypothetical protein
LIPRSRQTLRATIVDNRSGGGRYGLTELAQLTPQNIIGVGRLDIYAETIG